MSTPTPTPPPSLPRVASPPPASSTNTSNNARVRIGLDAGVIKAQQKWKRLAEINDDNSTAKDMASEIRSEFAALQRNHQPPGSTNTDANKTLPIHIEEGDNEEEENFDADNEEQERVEHLLASEYTSSAAFGVDKFLIAATFVRDGIHGRKIGCRLDRWAIQLNAAFHETWYRWVYTLVVLISCLLAFAERPGEQNDYLEVDLACMGFFAIDVFIRWTVSSAETKRKYLTRQPWAVARMALLTITVLDLVTNLLLPAWNPNRYSRALRPFFLITRRRNIRIIFASCVRALREVLIVLLLSFCLVGFFGLLGYLLFSDASNRYSAPFFASLHASMYTMLLIHNCLPYMVKSMYPYFQVTQWSAVFFIIFVLLTNLFLAKLTIAVSYKSYKQHTEKMLYKRLQKRKAALYAAFDILATDVELVHEAVDEDDERLRSVPTFLSRGNSERRGSSRFFHTGTSKRDSDSFKLAMTPITAMSRRKLTLETWIGLCEQLKPKWTSVESTLVFNTIDVEHTGYVDLADFYQLCSLLSVKLEKTKPSTAAAILQCFVPTLKRQTVRRWQLQMRERLLYEHIFFGKYPVVVAELIVGMLIMLSVVQAIQVNDIELAFSVNMSWRIVGFMLLCLFTLEVQLKLFAFGRREFFSRPFCRLDLGIAVVGWLFYAITTLNDHSHVSRVFYDLALATRSLRILKLLNLFPPFHEILWTMQRILPLIVQLLLVIFSFMYAFAIVTQANYGIALRDFPVELQPQSPNWFAVRHEFQFDTFAETLVTLFGVANFAGWDMVMDAAHAVTQSGATYVFFFSYRIAMANILLPIFVGFLVESFVSNAKSVEDSMETYVEAATRHQKTQDANIADLEAPPQPTSPTLLEEERLTLINSRLGDVHSSTPPAPRKYGMGSPASASSDRDARQGFRMRFNRKGSYVQGEMFDTIKLSDVSRLKIMVDKKDEEIARQEADIRQLESNVLGMQTRLSQSQRVILAYEAKLEELSTQLQAAQHRDSRQQSTSGSDSHAHNHR